MEIKSFFLFLSTCFEIVLDSQELHKTVQGSNLPLTFYMMKTNFQSQEIDPDLLINLFRSHQFFQ